MVRWLVKLYPLLALSLLLAYPLAAQDSEEPSREPDGGTRYFVEVRIRNPKKKSSAFLIQSPTREPSVKSRLANARSPAIAPASHLGRPLPARSTTRSVT